jgi:CHASE3 domain sensor protein
MAENINEAFSAEELARRRAAARRLAWLLGIAVLAIYLVGLFIKR